MRQRFFLSLIVISFLFICSCVQVKEVVKYKVYKFNEYITLNSVSFKPFKDNIFFKTKNIVNINGHKYKFYSLVYGANGEYRIFSYTFFGKRVSDIFFSKNKIYLVLGSKQILYIIEPNKRDEENSLFLFLKEILNGIDISNAKIMNGCITGNYKDFSVLSCEKDNFKKVYFYKKSKIKREFDIIEEEKDNYPTEIYTKIDKTTMRVSIKEKIKKIDFREKFFDSVKNYNIRYIKSLTYVERALLGQNKNE